MLRTSSVVFATLLGDSLAHTQPYYGVLKQQLFVQTSAAAPIADPSRPFTFKAVAATHATFTLPDGRTLSPPFRPEDEDYSCEEHFMSMAELDDAFPLGIYRVSGRGMPALSLDLAVDNYPFTLPQVAEVTNGAWTDDGTLAIDAGRLVALEFTPFPEYANNGVGGHVLFDLTGTARPRYVGQNVVTRPFLDLPVHSLPLTRYVIPPGTLAPGHPYEANLCFNTLRTLDGATGAFALLGKRVRFTIVTRR